MPERMSRGTARREPAIQDWLRSRCPRRICCPSIDRIPLGNDEEPPFIFTPTLSYSRTFFKVMNANRDEPQVDRSGQDCRGGSIWIASKADVISTKAPQVGLPQFRGAPLWEASLWAKFFAVRSPRGLASHKGRPCRGGRCARADSLRSFGANQQSGCCSRQRTDPGYRSRRSIRTSVRMRRCRWPWSGRAARRSRCVHRKRRGRRSRFRH